MCDRDVCQLVKLAREGDGPAMRDLMMELEPYLVRQATQLVSQWRQAAGWSHQSVSDLLQETRLRIWKGIPSFRGSDDADGLERCLHGWIGVIMKRALRDVLGPAARMPAMTPLDSQDAVGYPNGCFDPPCNGAGPSWATREQERKERIGAAMASIADPADRLTVEQYFFHGRSLRSIAGERRMEYTKLRRRFHAVLSLLGEDLGDLR